MQPLKPITPEEMQGLQSQAGSEDAQPVSQLVQSIGEGISKLSEVVGRSGGTEKDVAMIGQLQEIFAQIAAGLEQQPGEDAEEQGPSEVSADGGVKGVPVGPQVRN